MVRLEPMTEAEFQAYLEPAIAEYAAEHVKSGRWIPEEALEKSRKEYTQLLPDGLSSVDQHLFSIKDEFGTQVGMLWFAVRQQWWQALRIHLRCADRRAFQRRGYATQAFQALEMLASDMGINSDLAACLRA